jgi:hypothetical protein
MYDEEFQITLSIINLKRSFGGLGVRRQSDFTNIAFFSSFVAAIPSLNALFQQFAQNGDTSHLVHKVKKDMEKQMDESLRAIRKSFHYQNEELNENGLLPKAAEDMWTEFKSAPFLQRNLSQQLAKAERQRLLNDLQGNDAALARLQSSSHNCASMWLTALPENPHFLLNNAQFRLAVLHRLGLPPSSRLPSSICLCAALSDREGDLKEDPQHFHTCILLRKSGCYDRHQHIVRALMDICQHAGIVTTTSIEPLHVDCDCPSHSGAASASCSLVPDLLVFLADKKYMLDVSVTCPSAKSYRSAASKHVLSAAMKRAKEKNSKYSAACQKVGTVFVPFVLESYGAFHHKAEEFLQQISKQQYDNSTEQHEFLAYARRRIAFAIQKGNADIAQIGVRNLHRVALLPSSRQDDLPMPPRAPPISMEDEPIHPLVPVSPVPAGPPPQPHPPDPKSRHQFCSPSSALSSHANSSSPGHSSFRSPLLSPPFLNTENIADSQIIQPLINLYYEEDEREDARQQNRRNSSPASSPSHRHRRKD